MNFQFNLIREKLDAGVLECAKLIPDRADVINAPLAISVLQIVGRAPVVKPKSVLALLYPPNNGVNRLTFVEFCSHSRLCELGCQYS